MAVSTARVKARRALVTERSVLVVIHDRAAAQSRPVAAFRYKLGLAPALLYSGNIAWHGDCVAAGMATESRVGRSPDAVLHRRLSEFNRTRLSPALPSTDWVPDRRNEELLELEEDFVRRERLRV